MFLAIAAELDLELKAVDVSSAFLYPEYTGPPLFVRRPPGLPATDMPEYMELKKCIYGIKQAAHAFREHSDDSLRSIGFTPRRADPCMYIKRTSPSEFIWLASMLTISVLLVHLLYLLTRLLQLFPSYMT